MPQRITLSLAVLLMINSTYATQITFPISRTADNTAIGEVVFTETLMEYLLLPI